MKQILLSLIILFFSCVTFAYEAPNAFNAEEDGASVLSYEEEQKYFDEFMGLKGVFSQTTWRECSDYVTGNYSGYNCSQRRGISVILKGFMEDHFLSCAQEATKAYNGQRAVDLHLVHDGIQGDARHSPRSLHAEARAIDVDTFLVTYSNGRTESFRFKDSSKQRFFNSFRQCWGKRVHDYNGCPYISGTPGLTGSIGKEDRNHQNHMHVSVPYCVNGLYAGKYYRR